MKIDPSFCNHTNIGKSIKIDTVSVPELCLEQLVIRIKVYCRDCKEAFIPKTMSEGFSTSEIGVVGDELFVPLEYPQETDLEVPDEALMASEKDVESIGRQDKDHLH